MTYTSFYFYVFVSILLVFYYVIPLRFRWVVLLGGSAFFYLAASHFEPGAPLLLFATIVLSFLLGILLGKPRFHSKAFLIIAILLSFLPLLFLRLCAGGATGLVAGNGQSFINRLFRFGGQSGSGGFAPVAAVGLSFYTLQIISYLADIYRERITPQKNFAKYALFISFFPQILQGPIPRYEQLEDQLLSGHRFQPENIVRGYMLITWGFFLKYMIADKAGIVVDAVFGSSSMYQGSFVLAAGILYSVQLYADFLSCTTISQGVARLFDIRIIDNFHHPYFAVSVKDFWRRWHMSLSSWLRDYIYIPLGGNRKGKTRKYLNVFLTFLVSGIWHGSGIHFIVWGAVHGFYQIMGELLRPFREKCKRFFGVRKGSRLETVIARIITFFLVMFAWILFRASSLRTGLRMILSVFTVRNPWIFFDDSLLDLGLSWKEWVILVFSVLVLYKVSKDQERGIVITDRVLRQPLFVRWILYIAATVVILVFGTYGFGFNAKDFIYMNF